MAEILDEKTKEVLKKNISKALEETNEVSGGGIYKAIENACTGNAKEISWKDGADFLTDYIVGRGLEAGISKVFLGTANLPWRKVED